MTKLRMQGITLPSLSLGQRGKPVSGDLLILTTDDQGLHRPVKLARLMAPGTQVIQETLIDPCVLWARHGRFTLAGFERSMNQHKERVEYAQSWLCEVDLTVGAEQSVDAPSVGQRTYR